MGTKKTITTNSNLSNVQKFVTKFADSAVAVEKSDQLPAEAMMAQVALETGWGGHILKGKNPETGKTVTSRNLFNIKQGSSWQGAIVTRRVHEYTGSGEKYYTLAAFRRYETFEESFADYARLIRSLSRYTDAVHAAAEGNVEAFLRAVQAGGYATDPKYADKCIGIIKKYFVVTLVNQPEAEPVSAPKEEKTGCSEVISQIGKSLRRALGKKEKTDE